nr:helix-turn-helix transcriptional regulator [uncultured Faecalimonas sp.]
MELNIGERIEILRKDLSMSRRVFGERLGVSESVIVNIEYDRLKRPDQKETLYKLICKEFNVNEEWLRTGEGEMFAEVPVEDEYFKAVTQISKSNDKLAMQAIIEYWKLDDVSKETLRNYIYKIAEKSRE